MRLRHPPGGRDARTMLTAQFLDRTGTGVWSSASVLYFTVEAGFDTRRIGVLLGLGGVAGILGSPVDGRLAGRHPVRTLLSGCHILRLATLCVILTSSSFAVLLPAVAMTVFGDRAAKTLEMLFATQVAGPERATYRLSRSVANAGYALGAGIAAIGLAVGTRDAYRVLILLDALSFAAISIAWYDEFPRSCRRGPVIPRGRGKSPTRPALRHREPRVRGTTGGTWVSSCSTSS